MTRKPTGPGPLRSVGDLPGAAMANIGPDRRRLVCAAATLGLGGVMGANSSAASTASWVLKTAQTDDLIIGYAETGPADGPPAVLLHGWPYDVHAFADVAPLLAAEGLRVIVPHLRGYGSTRFRSPTTPRNGQQAVLACDVIALMDALSIPSAVIGGFDWGARSADIVAALWPDRCKGLVSVSGYLIGSQQAGRQPLAPEAELSWWYQFYFATERGARGYAQNREAFARLIWKLASPRWTFDEATFARSAASLANPDHVAITLDNYRWRLGLSRGEPRYDGLEARLAKRPNIHVPTITLEGDANGAPHPKPTDYADKFTGRYAHRLVTGGIGHNLPQEAPEAFAQAILDVGRWAMVAGGFATR